MRKKQLKNQIIAVSAILFLSAMSISAQVNIGTIEPPHAAAVLDLSQKAATAPDRGLLLPHVSLTNLTDFQLIAIPDNDQKSKGAGMVVWNTGVGSYICPGVYLWSNDKWNPLTPCPTPAATDPLKTPIIRKVSCPECGEGGLFEVLTPYPDLADTEKFVWSITSVSPNIAVTGVVSGYKDSQFFVPYDATQRTYTVRVYAKTNGARPNSQLSDIATATGKLNDINGFWLTGEVFYDIYATPYQTETSHLTQKYGTNTQRERDPNRLTSGTLNREYTASRTYGATGTVTYTWSVSDPDNILETLVPATGDAANNTQKITFKSSVLNDTRIKNQPDKALSVTLTCVVTVENAGCSKSEYTLTKWIEVRDRTTGCTLPSTLATTSYKGDNDANGYITFQCYNLNSEPMRISEQIAYMTAPNTNNKWRNTTGRLDDPLGNNDSYRKSANATCNNRVYGDLYQWGRKADGHQIRYNGNSTSYNCVFEPIEHTSLDATGQVPVTVTSHYGKHIVNRADSYYDWIKWVSTTDGGSNTTTRMYPRRWDGTGTNQTSTPFKVVENDPCPSGWRVPTADEWRSLVNGDASAISTTAGNVTPANGKNTWVCMVGGIKNTPNAYFDYSTPGGYLLYEKDAFTANDVNATPALFLPAAGFKYAGDNVIDESGSNGRYWSSTVNGSDSWYVYFSGSSVNPSYSNGRRSYGASVRCVAEN